MGVMLGLTIRVAIKERINLVADVEHGRAGGGEEHICSRCPLKT